MSKTPWTPGPWRIGNDATGAPLSVWAATAGTCITSVFDRQMGDDAPPMRQALANARLIAEAPAMAEALEHVDATFEMFASYLKDGVTTAEFVSVFNATAENVTAILTRIKGDAP